MALFPLVNSGSIVLLTIGLMLLTVGLGLTYGPQAALYAELFPASIRFSGVSIAYALGAISVARSPTIATPLVESTGTTVSVTVYLAIMAVLGLVATPLLLRDRSGIPSARPRGRAGSEPGAGAVEGLSRLSDGPVALRRRWGRSALRGARGSGPRPGSAAPAG